MTPMMGAPEEKESGNRRIWTIALAVFILGLLVPATYWAIQSLRPAQLNGVVLQGDGPVPNFTLTTQTGEQASLHDYRGKVVLLYFGYTYCPDVCPITLDVLDKAIEALPERQQDDVQVIMVSVDPERDTPEVLAKYLAYFNPDFVGMTGTVEEVQLAGSPLGIYAAKREVEGAAGYFMDHTATVAAIDRQGRLRLVWPFGMPVEEIASDLGYLVRE